ncbi:MAG: hypothetical protein ABSD81_04635 [Methanomicrobiales archaeon]
MQTRGWAAFCILAIIISCIPCVNAQADITKGSDYKWSFAQTYSEKQLADSGMKITDADIAFARMRVASAEKDCSSMGGIWCTYANDDRNALQRMLNVQAKQQNNPSPVVVDTSPIPDFTNIIQSAWSQLVAIAKGIFGWD